MGGAIYPKGARGVLTHLGFCRDFARLLLKGSAGKLCSFLGSFARGLQESFFQGLEGCWF